MREVSSYMTGSLSLNYGLDGKLHTQSEIPFSYSYHRHGQASTQTCFHTLERQSAM